MLGLLYTIVIAPLRLGFEVEDYCPSGIWVWETIIDIGFIIDLLLNFVTAVYNDTAHGTELDFNPYHIAKAYVHVWLWVDLASSLPIDLIMSLTMHGCGYYDQILDPMSTNSTHTGNDSSVRLLRLVRILRLVKMVKILRVLKLQNRVNDLGDRFPSLLNLTMFKLIRLLFITIYIAHLLACGFYAVGAAVLYSADERSQELSWLVSPNSGLELKPTPGLTWQELGAPYTAAMYWTFTTITTVGYGDLTPRHMAERWYAMMCMMIGTLVFGQVVANITEILESAGGGHKAMQARLNALHAFMREKKLSYELQVRIRRHFRFYWQRAVTLDDAHDELLRQLSAPLRHDVVKAMYRSVISALPVFSLLEDENFWDAMLRAMQPHLISPDETLITQGRLGNEMFLVTHGRLEVFYTPTSVLRTTQAEPKHIRNITTGGHVGEIALFSAFDLRDGSLNSEDRRDLRSATVIARAHCELFAIERQSFLQICKDYTSVRDHFMHVAMERVKHTDKLDAKVSKVAAKFARRLQTRREQTVADIGMGDSDQLHGDKRAIAASVAPTSLFGTLSLLSDAKREHAEVEAEEAVDEEPSMSGAGAIPGPLSSMTSVVASFTPVANVTLPPSPGATTEAFGAGPVQKTVQTLKAVNSSSDLSVPSPPAGASTGVHPGEGGELRAEMAAMRNELATLRHDLLSRLPDAAGRPASIGTQRAMGSMRGAMLASKLTTRTTAGKGIFGLSTTREATAPPPGDAPGNAPAS